MIQISYSLESEDLSCSICYDTVNTPYFVCIECIAKCKRTCPICITSKVFHNKLLEKHIKHQMVSCSNQDCPVMVFEWSQQDHLMKCPFKQFILLTLLNNCNLFFLLKGIMIKYPFVSICIYFSIREYHHIASIPMKDTLISLSLTSNCTF
jgi:hypothetical protein